MGRGGRLFAALLLSMLACASKPADEPPLPRISAVLLAPVSFNQNLPAPLEKGAPIVQEIVAGVLWEWDIRVSAPPADEFQGTWKNEGQSVGSLYGADGKLDPARFDAAVNALIAAYRARGVQFDALVIPYLAVRSGAITGQSVGWDGTSRQLPLERSNRDVTHMVARRGLHARCTSVLVLVYDAQGKRLFERYGGLEVAQRMQMAEGHWRWTDRGDLFRNRKDLEEGVRFALQPLIED